MVDFIMDFMGFFCYFHNKSTYKIINVEMIPKTPILLSTKPQNKEN